MTAQRPSAGDRADQVQALIRWLSQRRRWFVLTGAGCSTESGIPAYRDEKGAWRHKAPIQFADFVRSEAVRKRYWARSFAGFERMHGALPNAAHRALECLERLGLVRVVVTQNVDHLHQKAGSRSVIDLHGQLAMVVCLGCSARFERLTLQARLAELNPQLAGAQAFGVAPDGDAELDPQVYRAIRIPECPACGGILKPDVVFFGEAVPRARVAAAYSALGDSDAVLVVGSSLSVFSGYRFVRRAAERGLPILVINNGWTRADAFVQEKLEGPCGFLLESAVRQLSAGP